MLSGDAVESFVPGSQVPLGERTDVHLKADADFAWARLDENAAAGLCYTSGTTGKPKGVLYSHRSNVLHAMANNSPDYIGLRSRDVAMPVVPLFHANSWSLAFLAPMTGAGLVLPGPRLDGASLHELLERAASKALKGWGIADQSLPDA